MYSIFGCIVGRDTLTAQEIADAFNIEYGTDFTTLDMEREYLSGFLVYNGKAWILYWEGKTGEYL